MVHTLQSQVDPAGANRALPPLPPIKTQRLIGAEQVTFLGATN